MLPERKGILIEPYGLQHIPAVQAFNQRLQKGNQSILAPESPISPWLPRGHHNALYQDYYVAWDGQHVRGCYVLKWQPFWLQNRIENIADYQLPISEGIVDPTYAMVGVSLLKDALRRSPKLFALGLGWRSEPVVRFLAAMRWLLIDCPFFFSVVRPFRFLRGMKYLRTRASRRFLLDLAAFTGLGSLGLRAVQRIRRRVGLPAHTVSPVNGFGDWANGIWEASRDAYTLIAQRDAGILNVLYPADDSRFIRLRVEMRGEPVGWAVLLNTPMREDKYFGDLRVGSLVDCLALPGHEMLVVAASRQFLARAGVDLVVTNLLAPSWCAAARADGFLEGPSNFILAISPVLAEQLQPKGDVARIHMTRGDGDGPIHL